MENFIKNEKVWCKSAVPIIGYYRPASCGVIIKKMPYKLPRWNAVGESGWSEYYSVYLLKTGLKTGKKHLVSVADIYPLHRAKKLTAATPTWMKEIESFEAMLF